MTGAAATGLGFEAADACVPGLLNLKSSSSSSSSESSRKAGFLAFCFAAGFGCSCAGCNGCCTTGLGCATGFFGLTGLSPLGGLKSSSLLLSWLSLSSNFPLGFLALGSVYLLFGAASTTGAGLFLGVCSVYLSGCYTGACIFGLGC